MDINHAKKGEITIITINGRLDGTKAPVADKTIKKILEGNCSRLLFDCSELNYLSCVGLRIILEAVAGLKRNAGKIVLCCLTDSVKKIFEVSGFYSVIPITDSVESGIKQLG